jgi:hypothetical protein
MSHGQKLSTTSGEPEFVAQKFFEIPTSDSSMPCTDREEKGEKDRAGILNNLWGLGTE